ncbi:LysR substrate-binding protein (plasmid) [Gemmatirosa kalamazoonensis]|uniref:LysR substrate-binding protein n=1 Tax=Gemmatirosa kalamazoonensis TaxID=861299 RepID=W0RNA6_9BACT|nr:LysR family transcriptional regulator [Gemmatirosa kalamazoonensis]AHG92221.1 LysR substrate-binding protein [Gemmatirosa kalamazoonensis]
MELRHLRYFVAVAEELHFGRAAERLHIAQPPLSRQIRDLERELGEPLLERGARGVTLTAAGRAFLPEARLVLAQAERARRTAQRAAAGETGRLRVGFVEAATYGGVLHDVLGFFRLHLPNIGLSLFELDPAQQADAFRDGRIDLGILHAPPPDAARWLHVEAVYGVRMIVALPEAHALAPRARVALGDLADEPFVLFPRPSAPALHDEIVTRCRRAGFEPRVVQEATGWHTVAGLVAAGIGVAFVPASLAELRRPGVAYRPVTGLTAELTLHVAWKRGERSPVRDRFVTALKAVARTTRRPRPRSRARPPADRGDGAA